jgi:hypothetical protein
VEFWSREDEANVLFVLVGARGSSAFILQQAGPQYQYQYRDVYWVCVLTEQKRDRHIQGTFSSWQAIRLGFSSIVVLQRP